MGPAEKPFKDIPLTYEADHTERVLMFSIRVSIEKPSVGQRLCYIQSPSTYYF